MSSKPQPPGTIQAFLDSGRVGPAEPTWFARAADIYFEYAVWCDIHALDQLGGDAFKEQMIDAGIAYKRRKQLGHIKILGRKEDNLNIQGHYRRGRFQPSWDL